MEISHIYRLTDTHTRTAAVAAVNRKRYTKIQHVIQDNSEQRTLKRTFNCNNKKTLTCVP